MFIQSFPAASNPTSQLYSSTCWRGVYYRDACRCWCCERVSSRWRRWKDWEDRRKSTEIVKLNLQKEKWTRLEDNFKIESSWAKAIVLPLKVRGVAWGKPQGFSSAPGIRNLDSHENFNVLSDRTSDETIGEDLFFLAWVATALGNLLKRHSN